MKTLSFEQMQAVNGGGCAWATIVTLASAAALGAATATVLATGGAALPAAVLSAAGLANSYYGWLSACNN